MARRTAESKLGQLASELGAERAPYYMRDRPRALTRTFPAPGWYWVPSGHQIAVYLGWNYDESRDVLVTLISTSLPV
jgi:hypothetical protein